MLYSAPAICAGMYAAALLHVMLMCVRPWHCIGRSAEPGINHTVSPAPAARTGM